MENKTVRITDEQIEEQYSYMHKVSRINREKAEETGRLPMCYVLTFGCQQNESDSEKLAGMAAEMDYVLTQDPKEADLILVNTCAVREHAEIRALSITGQFKHLKAKKPSLRIGICGCMVTQEHRKEDVKHKYPYVDFLFDTNMLWRFSEIVYTALTVKKRTFWFDRSDGNVFEGMPVKRALDFKAYVSIMYGCNNFCTYCVVPYVRGRERSRLKEDVLNEVEGLIKTGYAEITLLGQNVNSYGKDLYSDYDFADLLSDVCKINGEFRVRFMTSHPRDASHKLIDTVARESKIVKHIHLPFQSGSDEVLKRMNRHYTRSEYLSLIEYAKKTVPDIGLTSDVIVGFPGETDSDFEDTLSLIKTVGFDSIFTFIYSVRKGTPAAKMEQVPEEIKKKRFAILLETQNAISKEKNVCEEGKILRVLVEGRSKTDPEKFSGRTEKNVLVHFDARDSDAGKFFDVRITKADTFAMYGELIR